MNDLRWKEIGLELGYTDEGIENLGPWSLTHAANELFEYATELRKELAEYKEPRDTVVPPDDISAVELLKSLDRNPTRKTRWIADRSVREYLQLCDKARNQGGH